MLASGGRIAKRYLLARLLGRGGMAEVWQASDQATGDSVALKFPADDPAARARLAREARALAAVASPCVCALVEADPGYLALELLDGGTLETRLAEGPLPFAEAQRVVSDILHGLADAHAAGVLHRDVKPSNVALVRRGKKLGAKLLDLGAARIDDPSEATLTSDGALVGTLLYAAPERLAGAPADARADVYAAGLVAFRAIAGRLPFDDARTSVVARRHADPASLAEATGTRWSDAFEDFFRGALARDPEGRFATAAIARAAWDALDAARAPRVTRAPEAPAESTSTLPRGRR